MLKTSEIQVSCNFKKSGVSLNLSEFRVTEICQMISSCRLMVI